MTAVIVPLSTREILWQPMDNEKQFSYYSFAKILSYNATYNFVPGGRGIGKTYGAKDKGIADAIKSGIANGFDNCDQFIYLRRYKEELQMSADTFFADIAHKFPDWDFRRVGFEAQISPAGDREVKRRVWKTIGYFVALSVAQKFKSVAFPRVKLIIYDEFIIEKGVTHYLPNEAIAFNNFYSTVDRWKDKTRVIFIANSVAITNPFFIHYKIDPALADKNGFLKVNVGESKGFLICHFPDSSQFASEVYQTKFGKFIEGTEYADYAVGNQFADANDALIGDKRYQARYLFTLDTFGVSFSVWYDMMKDKYHCQEKRPKEEIIYTLNKERMSEEKTLMTFSDRPLGMLRNAFNQARVTFDKPQTRNAFFEIYKR
jgi:hypothetical protein